LGCHNIEDFENADVVIKNPGVKYSGNKYLAVAKQIETDLSIFLHFTKAPIIAITGSKGKSSTVSAIHYGLTQAGFKTFLGGNITVSPLTFLDKTSEKTPVVLELSSWQLSDLRGRKLLKPYISLITKIVPDHQNWYGNMESYVADKKLIYADQDESCFSIFTSDDQWGEIFASESKAQILRYSSFSNTNIEENSKNAYGFLDKNDKGWIQNKLVLDETLVPGHHMKENLLNAGIVMSLMKVPQEEICKILSTYKGIHHRLEYFYEWTNSKNQKIKFYNDSAATVPEAAAAAISSFKKNVFAICGGTDKELDFLPLAENAHKATKLFLLAGTGTDKLLPMLQERKIEYFGPYGSLQELLEIVKNELNDFDQECVVVFSPGATSFGMFNNEFDRGEKYKKAVTQNFN
jgi:UDP-N-acetylmuramoylalanine--D-glutamate ligase